MRSLVCRMSSVLLASALALGACGGDSGTEAQSQYTDFEANQVLTLVANAIGNVDTGAPGFAAAVEPVNISVTCSVSGTANVVGTRDPGPAVDFDARITYTDCASASIRINGIIDVTATSSTPSAGVVKVTWTFLGTVTSKKDSRTRSCTMDVTRVNTTTNGTLTTTTSGSLCNRTAH